LQDVILSNAENLAFSCYCEVLHFVQGDTIITGVIKKTNAAKYLDIIVKKKGGKVMRYRILIEQDEDGVFIAECPSLPGCVSQGKTRKEALDNIQDAMKGYVESLKKHNEPIPH